MEAIGKSILSVVAALVMMMTGCTDAVDTSGTNGGTTSSSSSETGGTENPTEDTTMELTQKSFSANAENVKLIGRTTEYEGIRFFGLSAAGVEFTFTGTSVSFTLVSDSSYSNADKRARYAVYVDGERVFDDVLDSEEKVVEAFSADEPTTATIKLLKLSEAQESIMGIKSIDVTSVGDIAPTAEKELKIEFIGDSITCGYGVDDEDRDHHFKTSTEDATKAYAYKTAEALGADYSLVSYSGNGIVSGYTSDGTKTDSLVPAVYDRLGKWGYWGDLCMQDVVWDFSQFQPDYVVINLGTNDASYTSGDKTKVYEYIDSYVAFLKDIREKNPDAHIICSLGIMGTDLCVGVTKAAAQYTEETGDTNISAFRFKVQNGETNGYAADWHPTEKTHEIAAADLTAYIKELEAEK